MIRVGMSYTGNGDSYANYPAALRRTAAASGGFDIEPVWLTKEGVAAAKLAEVDALLLTGGVDVDPVRYGRVDAVALCHTIDNKRDAIEFALVEAALVRKIPVLAICRGMQLLNVHAGGTLIPHLDGHRSEEGDDGDRIHEVDLAEDSSLARIAGKRRTSINSSHHQAVDRVASAFRVTAIADDGTIEAFEWQDPAGKSPLLAVQWHPERMPSDDPLGGGIFKSFLSTCLDASRA